MLNDSSLKVSPHGSFKVTQLCQSVAICEATKGDRFDWGNATDSSPAFIVYLGCQKTEVAGYMKTFNLFYRCDWCETRKPKYLKDFEVEIKIRGMQRESDSHAFGLDYLIRSETAKHPTSFNLDLDFCIADIADNFVYEREEYQEIPASLIQAVMFEAINEWLDKFANAPEQHISDRLIQKLDEIAAEYSAA